MRRLRQALAEHLAGLPATFWWLWVGALVSALATFVFPFVALFLAARGFSPAQAGRVVSSFGAGMLLSPLAGALSDRVGRRPVILLSLVGAASGAAALAFLAAPWAIAAAVAVYAASLFAAGPAFQAAVADVVPTEARARAYALVHWANNFGAGVSLLLGGVLAAGGWALPFLCDAATTLLFAALVAWRVPETRPEHPLTPAVPPAPAGGEGGPAGARAQRRGPRTVLGDRELLKVLALHVPFATVFWQFQSSAPLDMARHGLAPARFGLVLATNAAVITFFQPFVVRLTARLPPARVLAAAALLVGLGYGGYGLAGRAPGYALATALWTFGEIAYLPTASALVAALAPPALRGRYAGAYALAFGLGGLAAPLAGPPALERYGSAALWASCLAVAGAVGAGYLALGPARPSPAGDHDARAETC